jgi:peptidoglycan/xylan/chitin deacetylase (PgdA/CDA1 family)
MGRLAVSLVLILGTGIAGAALALGIWLRRVPPAIPPPIRPPVGTIAPRSQSAAVPRVGLPSTAMAALPSPTTPTPSPSPAPSPAAVPGPNSASTIPQRLVGAMSTPAASAADGTAPRVAVQASAIPRSGGVPILMYHYIRVNPVPRDRAGYILSVPPRDFAAQMGYLSEAGFHTVTMAQVRDHLLHGTPLPPRPVAVTLDDGYEDAYTAAWPVLQRFHQTATLYIVTGFVGRPGYLTWEQIGRLDRAGLEIGSHTVHHLSLPHLAPAALQTELTTSRQTLEAHLGHPVLDFCYPGGEFNQQVEDAVAAAGYATATTTRYGLAGPGDDPLALPRIRVFGGESLAQFAAILSRAATAHPQ